MAKVPGYEAWSLKCPRNKPGHKTWKCGLEGPQEGRRFLPAPLTSRISVRHTAVPKARACAHQGLAIPAQHRPIAVFWRVRRSVRPQMGKREIVVATDKAQAKKAKAEIYRQVVEPLHDTFDTTYK